MTLGYYTAGFLMCLIGEPMNYDTCRVYRSKNAYPTQQSCMEDLALQAQLVPYVFNPDDYYIADVKCIEWIASGDQI